MSDELIFPQNAPAIAGLRFRHFRGESDYPKMLKAFVASIDADQVDHTTTLDDVANTYTHLSNCDPYQDMIFVEMNGEVIGYSRGWWNLEADTGSYLYGMTGFLVPEWRRKGIGQAVLQWVEDRMRTVAAGHPADSPKFYNVFASQHQASLIAMLEKSGYSATRYFHEMVRPSLEDIPDFHLPAGLEVRPALPEHYRLIWEAQIEAFHDHWGFPQLTEDDYQGWLNDTSSFQPHLWQVAWDLDTNQVAGQVLTFILHAENEKFNRKRGYTESISVRRPWRKRGLARALIALSLRAQKDQGMLESALGVDSENLSGATRIYEDCGFQVVKRNTVYRKPLSSD
jgi:GNAT superfamily N-acetyltransferase